MTRKSQMTTRERFRAAMNFQPFDRLPIIEWAHWWHLTIERWHSEGLPADITDRYDLCRHFGLDVYYQCGFPVRAPGLPPPACEGAPVVGSMEDYERVRPYLFPKPVAPKHWKRWAREQRKGNAVVWFTIEGFFWFPRTLLGIEQHLFAFYEQPELMHRMNQDLAEWQLQAIDAICDVCTPDFMTFAEDMSYNRGPMISRKLFDEFMKPYYERVIPRMKERGIVCIVDSDGDVTVPAQWFEDAGLDGILPLERHSGVDIAALRQAHPRMRFIGHFDKMTMNREEEIVRAEFERLLPTAAGGGFLISCDHQTPPGVSYEQYQVYLRLFREFADEAGRLSQAAAARVKPVKPKRKPAARKPSAARRQPATTKPRPSVGKAKTAKAKAKPKPVATKPRPSVSKAKTRKAEPKPATAKRQLMAVKATPPKAKPKPASTKRQSATVKATPPNAKPKPASTRRQSATVKTRNSKAKPKPSSARRAPGKKPTGSR